MKAVIFYNISFLLLSICIHSVAQTEGLIQNKNVSIYYRVYGKGKPLLIINGGPGLNSDGCGLAKDLSAGNQTIIYDQRVPEVNSQSGRLVYDYHATDD
jgi:proline iminopeptidase